MIVQQIEINMPLYGMKYVGNRLVIIGHELPILSGDSLLHVRRPSLLVIDDFGKAARPRIGPSEEIMADARRLLWSDFSSLLAWTDHNVTGWAGGATTAEVTNRVDAYAREIKRVEPVIAPVLKCRHRSEPADNRQGGYLSITSKTHFVPYECDDETGDAGVDASGEIPMTAGSVVRYPILIPFKSSGQCLHWILAVPHCGSTMPSCFPPVVPYAAGKSGFNYYPNPHWISPDDSRHFDACFSGFYMFGSHNLFLPCRDGSIYRVTFGGISLVVRHYGSDGEFKKSCTIFATDHAVSELALNATLEVARTSADLQIMDRVFDADITPDGRYLVLVGALHTTIVSTDDWQTRAVYTVPGHHVAVSPGGDTFSVLKMNQPLVMPLNAPKPAPSTITTMDLEV